MRSLDYTALVLGKRGRLGRFKRFSWKGVRGSGGKEGVRTQGREKIQAFDLWKKQRKILHSACRVSADLSGKPLILVRLGRGIIRRSWWFCNVKMYDQREPLKYGSTYLPRQTSNSRRFKNGPRPFMSRPSDFIIVAVFVVASGVGSMWFISRLPYFLDGASSVYDRATTITLTWGTPSMWWLFVNLIVGAIVVSSGFVSAFSSSSGTDPYQPVYIEKDISDPTSPGVRLDSSSDIPEDSGESYGEEAFRSYVKPAKPKIAQPIPYSKLQPEHETPPVYEATSKPEATIQTDERGADQVGPPEDERIQAEETPASLSGNESVPSPSEPPVGYPVPLVGEPAKSVEVETAESELGSSRSVPPVVLSRTIPSVVSSRSVPPVAPVRNVPAPVVIQGEPDLVSRVAEPKVVLSRSIPSVGVAVTEPEEDVAFANQEKIVADNAPVRSVEPSEGDAREDAEPSVAYPPPPPGFLDPFPTINDPPIGYAKLQRNFTEGTVHHVRPYEPLISAPPPKAELVKAHTFTSSRGIRREQIDSYVEPLAKKLEEMKRNEEMKWRDESKRKAFQAESARDDAPRRSFHAESGFHAERVRQSRDVPVEPIARDTGFHAERVRQSRDVPVEPIGRETGFHAERVRHTREIPVEPIVRDTRPAKVHSRNTSVDVTSKDIPHFYPTEVFCPPPVQTLPPDIARYFTSPNQVPFGEAELRQVTPAPPPAVVRPKKVAPAEERPDPKKTIPADVSEWSTSKKPSPGEVSAERTSSRKQSPTDIHDRAHAEQAPYVDVSYRPPPKKPPTAETIAVESVPARSTISKKTAVGLETLADKLKGKKAPADGLSDLLQRAPSTKKTNQPGGTGDASKQASQTENMQRPPQKPTFPIQTPVQPPIPPPVTRLSPPSSPPPAPSVRKQVPPSPPYDSPPRSPLILRPPPPPPLSMPTPLDDKDPYTSSDDVSGYGFYGVEGRNPLHKNEATSSADVFGRSAKFGAPVEEVFRGPSQKVSSKSRPPQRKRVSRPPPPREPEPPISDGTESEITEEGRETDDFHKQIDSFLAKMHQSMALERQESMARRNVRLPHEI
ncbi:hypothetical protein R1flu_019241 [Riccia fluitans]|uniref:Uncharacterized protein n=1 Tax=Riccia fluitans TaxID=41844 RepID=A0ABD1ZI48_9MARC